MSETKPTYSVNCGGDAMSTPLVCVYPRHGGQIFVALSALVAAAVLELGSAPAQAQTHQRSELYSAQGNANRQPGPGHFSARTIPVPTDLDSETAAFVAAPYSSSLDLEPPNDEAWRAILEKAAVATAKSRNSWTPTSHEIDKQPGSYVGQEMINAAL